MKKKVRILGAGISGLCAAINLVKAGYDVEVFERGKDCGTRFKGDLQGLENWSDKEDILDFLKEINIKINFEADPVDHLRFSNGKKMWNLTSSKPAFYLVKRGMITKSLDQGLKEQALNLGVKIFFNKNVSEKQVDIVATGPDFKKIFGIDKGVIFKTKHKDMVLSILNKKDAYEGYSYLLIIKGYACIATCIGGDFKKLDQYFQKSEHILQALEHLKVNKPKPVGGVGAFSLNPKYKKGKKLYVGEAVGLQDLMWGFGMRNAFVSGYLAARSIIEKKDYAKLADNYFRNRLKASVVNRYLWDNFANKDYVFILNRLKNSNDFLKLLRSFYNFNLFQRIIYLIALSHCRKEYPKLKL